MCLFIKKRVHLKKCAVLCHEAFVSSSDNILKSIIVNQQCQIVLRLHSCPVHLGSREVKDTSDFHAVTVFLFLVRNPTIIL